MMLSSNKNNILLVSILFVLIGIFLRIYQLNFENYWLDEMLSFWVADPNLSLEDTLKNHYEGLTWFEAMSPALNVRRHCNNYGKLIDLNGNSKTCFLMSIIFGYEAFQKLR